MTRSRSRRGAPTFCPQGCCCCALGRCVSLSGAAISSSLQHPARHRRHFLLRVILPLSGLPLPFQDSHSSLRAAISPSGLSLLPQGHHFSLRVIISLSVSPLPLHSRTFSPRAAISPSGLSLLPQGHHFPPRVIISPSVSPLPPHSRAFCLSVAISPSGFSFSLQGGHSHPMVNTAGNRGILSIPRISIPHFSPLQTLRAKQGSVTAFQPCSISPFFLREWLKLPGHTGLTLKKGHFG